MKATSWLNRLGLLAVLGALMLVMAVPVTAQSGQALPPSEVWAEGYNVLNIMGQGANTFTWNFSNATSPGACYGYPLNNGASIPFFVFGLTSAPVPIFIRDVNPTLSEVVTPSSATVTGSSCGFSASPANSHTTFWVSSGSAGLYEALYANLKSPALLRVNLDAYWKTLVAALPGSKTVGGLIASIPTSLGSVNLVIVDKTTTPATEYAWNGAAYAANGGGLPTIAAGAGLGTGPAGLTVTGNGAGGVISVTSGTSTATGTLFTLTFLSGTTQGGFNHSPTCTIAAIGANTPAGTLAAGSVGGSSAAGYTQPFTIATTALTASTFYSFSYSCK